MGHAFAKQHEQQKHKQHFRKQLRLLFLAMTQNCFGMESICEFCNESVEPPANMINLNF